MGKNQYLTDANGCYILTAQGCRIVISSSLGGGLRHERPADVYDQEDEEIMLFITAFMETRCCELN